MKSILRYPGSKWNLASKIVDLMPDHKSYLEPFFPTLTTNKGEGMKIVLSGKLPGKYSITNRLYDTSGIAPTLSTMQGGDQEPKIIQRSHGFNKGGEHKIAPTLTSHSYQENNLVKIVDFYNKIVKDEVGTLTSSGGGSTVRTGSFGVTDGYRIRKLTPRECWRLQGFPDWAFDKACYGEVIPQGYFDLLLSRKLSRKKWQMLWRITRKQRMSNSQLYKQAGNSVTVPVIAAIAKCFS